MGRAKKRVKKGELVKKVLLTAGKGLTIGTVLLFPPISGGLLVIAEIIQEIEGKQISRKKIKRVLSSLEKKGMISLDKTKDDWKFTFKKKGKKLLLKYKLGELKLEKTTKWDQKWRLVIFDIPQKKRLARDRLRRRLKLLGFRQLQRSIFIYPFECQQEVEWLIEFYRLKNYVFFVRADYIGNQEKFLNWTGGK